MKEKASPVISVPRQHRPNVLSLYGDIDLHVSPAVTAHLNIMIRKKPERIVVDLSRATYIDSAGLAVLILAMQQVEAYGGKFFLSGPQETLCSILESSRLDRIFRIFPDLDAALTHQVSDNFIQTRERLPFTTRSTV